MSLVARDYLLYEPSMGRGEMNNRHLKTVLGFLLLIGSIFHLQSVAATVNLVVDGSKKEGYIPHFWSECVGTGTMIYCLKPEWQVAAKIGREEAGFKRVRGHGILIGWNGTDNDGIMTRNGGTATYNWKNVDDIIDYLLSIDVRPSIELSFMPKALQSNGVISKPNDWNAWRDLIKEMVLHCIDRWGEEEVLSWYWEVWNEYDYSGFWNATEQDYYMLYQKAAEGAKSANPDIIIGGPVTTGPHKLQDFVTYCNSNNVPYNLLANHYYGEAPGATTDPMRIRDDNRIRSDVIKNSGKKLYSLNTEFNTTYTGQGGNTDANVVSMDSHINAPFVVKCAKIIIDDYRSGNYTLPDMLSYWAISDVFDESGSNKGSWIEMNGRRPFGAVFGLITYQGLRKATFNAYKMMHMMGDTLLSATGGSGVNDGADGFATISADGSKVAVIVYNFYKNLTQNGGENTVDLMVENLPFPHGNVKVTRYLVDADHSNPYAVWVSNGKPAQPDNALWDEMKGAQNLFVVDGGPKDFDYAGGAYTTSIPLGRYAVSLVMLEIDPTSASGERYIRSSLNEFIERSGSVVTLKNLPSNRPISLLVYDAHGRVLRRYEPSCRTIDLSREFSPGLYLLGMQAPGMNVVQKVQVW